jgi:hypothetical protein
MTPAERGGLVCVRCGRDLTADDAPPSVPVGMSEGCQTFRCATNCDHT